MGTERALQHSGATRDDVTKNEQPGLRLRLAHEARRIASQHSYLDAMKATTMRALERGEALEIRQALRGFRGSLEAHFELEEQLHFPALHGLHPEFAPDLTALVAEHERFRAGLGRLEEGAGQGPPDLDRTRRRVPRPGRGAGAARGTRGRTARARPAPALRSEFSF